MDFSEMYTLYVLRLLGHAEDVSMYSFVNFAENSALTSAMAS